MLTFNFYFPMHLHCLEDILAFIKQYTNKRRDYLYYLCWSMYYLEGYRQDWAISDNKCFLKPQLNDKSVSQKHPVWPSSALTIKIWRGKRRKSFLSFFYIAVKMWSLAVNWLSVCFTIHPNVLSDPSGIVWCDGCRWWRFSVFQVLDILSA